MKMTSEPRRPFLDAASMEAIDRVLETVHRLRAPGGCPWDQKQTPQSLRPYLIEEAYEVLEVLDQTDSVEKLGDPAIRDALKEEFGDVLLQIALHAEIAQEAGAFSFADIATTLDEKLIRRHPHVFGETTVKDSDDVVKKWDQIKAGEKAKIKGSAESALAGIPKGLPALTLAEKTISQATKAGFQWPNIEGPLGKLEEEIQELTAAVRAGKKEEVAEELGDLLFSVCNVAFMLKKDPEIALRSFLRKFESRFMHVEKAIQEEGKTLAESSLAEMDRHWDEAKRLEKEKK